MSILIRFGLVAGGLTAGFVNFISCGAQNYKASLAEDHPQAATNAEAASDPSSPEFGLHAPNGWVQVPIPYSVEKNFPDYQLTALQAAMKTWEQAVGKTLFQFKGRTKDTGSSFPDLYSSLTDQINNQYGDSNWKKNGKSNMVLATTIWNNRDNDYRTIETSDIHYNDEIYFIADALKMKPKDDREIVDMQSLALHELGHFLGLTHVDAKTDYSSIMNPSLYIGEGLASRALSVGDIERIQKIYGCEGSACDAHATAQAIMLSSRQTSSDPNPAH